MVLRRRGMNNDVRVFAVNEYARSSCEEKLFLVMTKGTIIITPWLTNE